MKLSMLATTLGFLLITACGDSTSRNGNPNNPQGADGYTPLVSDETSGGCRIRLVTPSDGETIDLRNGQSYQFAWTTDGSDCETPYTVSAAGNPANLQTGENIVSTQLSVSVGQISRKGGYFNVSAADLASLTSTDGTYQWVVAGWYGSHPASHMFHVEK